MTGSLSFARFAALSAVAVGAVGVAYSIAFVVFLHNSSLGLVLWGQRRLEAQPQLA